MIAKIDRASPSRMPELAVSKLAKTAARRMPTIPMYPRLRARILARCTTVRRRAANQSRMLGSPTHPLHTTMKAAAAISWTAGGAVRPKMAWTPISSAPVAVTMAITARRVRRLRGMTACLNNSRARPEVRKMMTVAYVLAAVKDGPKARPTWPSTETVASEPIARARYIRLRSRLTSQSRAVSTAIRAKAAEVTYWLTVRKPVSVTVTRTGALATNCEDRPEEAEPVLHELRRVVSHPSACSHAAAR